MQRRYTACRWLSKLPGRPLTDFPIITANMVHSVLSAAIAALFPDPCPLISSFPLCVQPRALFFPWQIAPARSPRRFIAIIARFIATVNSSAENYWSRTPVIIFASGLGRDGDAWSDSRFNRPSGEPIRLSFRGTCLSMGTSRSTVAVFHAFSAGLSADCREYSPASWTIARGMLRIVSQLS